MTPELETRLRQVFPTGHISEPDPSACDYRQAMLAQERIRLALIMLRADIGQAETWNGNPHIALFHIGMNDEPWAWWKDLPDDGKHAHIKKTGKPMVHIGLKVSAITNVFELGFWIGTLEDGGTRLSYKAESLAPTHEWAFIEVAVRTACRDAGLRELLEVEDTEPVRFLSEAGKLWCTLGAALLKPNFLNS
jgi:hypothetical protein